MEDSKAFKKIAYLSKDNASFSHILKHNGVLKLPTSQEDIFQYMAKIIIKQQLSLQVANSIWSKLLATSNNDLFNFLTHENTDILLNSGISKRKLESMLRLKQEHLKDNLNKNISADNINETKNYICSLYGFGEWSSEMICLFYLGSPDIWSKSDATLNKAIKLLNIDNNFIDNCSPYKSYLALHLWKAIDSKLI